MLTKTLILTSTYPAELSPPNANSHHRLRRLVTITLHTASLLASLAGISLFAAAIPRWNANFFHNSGPNQGDWTDGFSLGPLTFAFLYHATVLIYDQVQKRRRQTPALPSLSRRSLIIHTVVPILVLSTLIPALFVAGYGSLFRFWRPAVRTQSGILVCNMLNVFARECEPVLYAVGSLQIAGIVFGTLLWMLHFTLLLISLRDLRRQRLVKQLQKEKLAQYDSTSEKSNRHSRRRGTGSRSPSSSSSGEHRRWHQQWEEQGSSGSRGASWSNSLTGGESRMTAFVQVPEASHTGTPSHV